VFVLRTRLNSWTSVVSSASATDGFDGQFVETVTVRTDGSGSLFPISTD